jgi:hypothetical protein
MANEKRERERDLQLHHRNFQLLGWKRNIACDVIHICQIAEALIEMARG